MLMLLGLAAAQPAAAQPGAHRDEIDHWLDFIADQARSPRAAIGLWSLQPLWSLADQDTRQRIDRRLQALSENRRSPLSIRRLASRQRIRRLRAAGRSEAARRAEARLGFIERWWLAGPFGDELRDGLDRRYPPEQGERPGCSMPPGVDWRLLPAAPGGIRWLHPLLQPRSQVVVYACAQLELERAARVLLHAGCDDACKLWVDGREVLLDAGPHDLVPDQRIVSLKLSAGIHRLLLKLVQAEGAAGFVVALTDPAGRPIGLERTPLDAAALRGLLAAPPPEPPTGLRQRPSLADWFEERAAAHPDRPQLQAEAGWALYHSSARERHAAEAEQYLLRAVAGAAPSARRSRWRLWLARLSEDRDRTRRQLRLAAAETPDHPRPHARMGLLHQVRGEAARALAHHRRALAIDPRYLPSRLAEAELLFDLGLEARAERTIDRLVAALPGVAEVQMVAGSLYRRLEARKKARQAFERLVAIDAADELGLRSLHEMALEAGELDRALARLDRLQALDPLRLGWWLQRGRLLVANDRVRQGLAAIDRALELRPDDARPWLVRGEALLEVGRRDEALAAFGRARELRPQDAHLERRVRALEPQGAPFYAPWRVAPERFLAEATGPAPRAGAERLLDLRVVRLHPNGMASRFRQQVVRVTDARGVERFRRFRVEYAPGRQEVRVLYSRLWHADGSSGGGVLVDDYSLSEPWYNLYYDVHAREITFPDLRPGDRVELTTVVEDVGDAALLGDYFGDLVPLQFTEPVRRSIYVLLAPPDRALAFNQPGTGIAHDSRLADGVRIHRWQGRRLPAVAPEPDMPGLTETRAVLHLSTFARWGALATWFRAQVVDPLRPTPEIRELARELTAGLETPLERIRAIYRFVADSTRYVGLEFGIHSYVPYQCGQVLRRRFGDCKDKTALLIALYESIGIPARLALVRMQRLGRLDARTRDGGPASLAVFNHAICYLPRQDLWLDGTAALHDVHELPAQDQGVPALVIGPESQRLRQTPRTGSEHNWTELEMTVAAAPDRPARVDTQVRVQGVLAPQMRLRLLGGRSHSETFAAMAEELFPEARAEDVAIDALSQPERPLTIRARLAVPDPGQRLDGGYELPSLGKDTAYQRNLASLQTRRHDLLLGPAWMVRWRIIHQPPSGSVAAEPPAGGRVESPFGRAWLQFERRGDALAVDAGLRLETHRVAAAQYPAFRDFLGRVDRLLSQRVRFEEIGHGDPGPRRRPDQGEPE
jgi:tetratricopeptide (TPR) repeat protein/transglutaminase-like putative cysteine protease